MPQNDKTDSNKKVQTDKDKKNSQRGLWIIISVGCVLLGGVIFVGAFFVDSQKVRFITEFSLTVALATLVGVQAYIYKRQWDVMEGQRVQVERSIESAEKNSIYAQRGYVIAKIGETGEGSHQWRLRIENSGNTPANNVSVAYRYEFRELPPWDWDKSPFAELPEKQIVFDSGFTEVARLGVIAPAGYQIVRTPKVDPLTPEQHKQWRVNELRFFCWGPNCLR